jgi:hypothetical protein
MLLFLQKVEEFAAWTVFQDKEELFFRLERGDQFDNEGMGDRNQDLLFNEDLINLALPLDVLLLDDLERENHVVTLASNKTNFAVGATANDG